MKWPTVFHMRLVRITLVLGLAVALVFAPDAYLPMLARSFMLEWVMVFLAFIAWAAWHRSWSEALIAMPCAAVLLLQVDVPRAEQVGERNTQAFRVAHMNVLQPNDDHTEVLARALATKADLISIQEVGPEWAAALISGLSASHPYHHVVPRENCTGIALFSNRPFMRVRTITMSGTPFIEAVLDVDGEPVRVFAVHATSPGSYAYFQRRNAQLDSLAEVVRSEAIPTLVVGDLNTVHWDDAYQRFCARSGAVPITAPWTITWPSVGPLALIPLDHALISGGLHHSSASTFNISGSDHRGLLADLYVDHAR